MKRRLFSKDNRTMKEVTSVYGLGLCKSPNKIKNEMVAPTLINKNITLYNNEK